MTVLFNQVESLEGRTLLSGATLVEEGVVVVVGEARAANEIIVSQNETQVVIDMKTTDGDGVETVTQHTFDKTLVTKVIVNGGWRDDVLAVDQTSGPFTLPVKLVGKAGDDLLVGGDGKDALFGRSGRDTILGNGGDDRLWGSFGNDQMDGGAGKDRLWGNAGDDQLLGGDGDDRLTGGLGDDTLDGGAGNDRLWALLGTNVSIGGEGSDRLLGKRGSVLQDQSEGDHVRRVRDHSMDHQDA